MGWTLLVQTADKRLIGKRLGDRRVGCVGMAGAKTQRSKSNAYNPTVDIDARAVNSDAAADGSQNGTTRSQIPWGGFWDSTWRRGGSGSRCQIRWGSPRRGSDTLSAETSGMTLNNLQRVIRNTKCKEIVVGLPLRMSGAEGIQSEKMQAFRGGIAQAVSVAGASVG